jgi:phosphatidylserine/phosphatidylglycerophosphate/cardiolipin synthase-like enzyme
MKELFIYTILVAAIFGVPVFLYKLMQKANPDWEALEPTRPKEENTLFICSERFAQARSSEMLVLASEDNRAEHIRSRRAVLTRLLEAQASASDEISRVEHLRTLEDHRTTLRNALEHAAKRVIIVSPFLSAGAVKADRVDALVRSAVDRGVEVLIFTDRSLNMRSDGTENLASLEGRVMLEDAGAQVFIADRIHNKTLCIDDNVIIEGSFNWLSALRKNNHDHQRQENSLKLIGGDASRMITQEMRAMAQLAL